MKIYTYANDFAKFVQDNDGTRVLRIDQEMFEYWLSVLPPVYMNGIRPVEINGAYINKECIFGFAEGHETIVDFWQAGNDESGEPIYLCKRSDRPNGLIPRDEYLTPAQRERAAGKVWLK